MTLEDRRILRQFPVADFTALEPDRPLWTSSRLADLAPVVVNRDSGRAFFDMCAHRKAAILNGASQDGARLRCPYHGWSFGSDGNCAKGALTPVDQVDLGGLTLLTADAGQLDPDEIEDVAKVFAQFRWTEMAPVARRRYTVASHWAYWVENFLECYHCSFNHPQLCSVENHIAASSSGNVTALGEFYNAAGRVLSDMGAHRPFATDWDPESAVPAFIDFNTLVEGHGAATRSGAPVGPPITTFERHADVFYYGAVGPFFHFSLYFDHLFLTNFHPVAGDETLIECRWLAHEEADLPEDAVIWLWENTLLQDIELVNRLHAGRSLGVGGDPVFLDSEEQSSAFHAWFKALPGALVTPPRSVRPHLGGSAL